MKEPNKPKKKKKEGRIKVWQNKNTLLNTNE